MAPGCGAPASALKSWLLFLPMMGSCPPDDEHIKEAVLGIADELARGGLRYRVEGTDTVSNMSSRPSWPTSPTPADPPDSPHWTDIDRHYEALRLKMMALLDGIGIARG